MQVPGLKNVWVMPIKTRIDMLATGVKTPLGIRISGPELDEIERIGRDIEAVLAELPGTASVFAERVAGGRYVDIEIDRLAASRFGLNVNDVHDVVGLAIGGMDVTRSVEGRERYPISLRYPQRVRDSIERLRLLPVVTPAGAHIALGDVADIAVAGGPPVIKSENARISGWVYIDINGRDLGAYVAEAQRLIATEIELPAAYSIDWSGQYEYLLRAKERLSIVGPLTLAVIMLLLYLNFRSFAQLAIVMGTLPLAFAGGIWLLYLLDYELSVAVGVGFIALAGVAVEIGVVMLAYLDQAFRRHAETGRVGIETVRRAVIDGALRRLRPIVMTVAATIGGLLPIMFGGGTGSEVMRRIAAPMVGGMVSATLLTLVVIPALYLLWRGHRFGLGDPGA